MSHSLLIPGQLEEQLFGAISFEQCDALDGRPVVSLVHYDCVECEHIITNALCRFCLNNVQQYEGRVGWSCEDGCCFVGDLRLKVLSVDYI